MYGHDEAEADLAMARAAISRMLEWEFELGYESALEDSTAEEQAYLYGGNVARLMMAKDALSVLPRRKATR